MSVYWGLVLAVGPQSQSVTALSVPPIGGWYSQSATQPGVGSGRAGVAGQMGGSGRHLPSEGRGWVHTPPSPPGLGVAGGAATARPPSAVSQY